MPSNLLHYSPSPLPPSHSHLSLYTTIVYPLHPTLLLFRPLLPLHPVLSHSPPFLCFQSPRDDLGQTLQALLCGRECRTQWGCKRLGFQPLQLEFSLPEIPEVRAPLQSHHSNTAFPVRGSFQWRSTRFFSLGDSWSGSPDPCRQFYKLI